jgi:Tfp pilus assembly protein PilF
MCPSSGSLADYFFPAIREAGLIHEHDEWFRSSWEFLAKVVKDYPESENTYNTAGWLASRARRNLVQAQQFLEKALALNPTESNYLDTMAEIHFANGQRAKALEWSARALNYSPNSPDNEVLLRQYEHFLKDPLPK